MARVDAEQSQEEGVVYGPFPCDSIGDLFLSVNATEISVAKGYCRTCPFKKLCQKNAERTESSGIWGGEYYIDGKKSEQPFSGSKAVRTMTDDEAFNDDPFSIDYDLDSE